MTVLVSRQDIYDYCRSVFIKHHVDLTPTQYQVGSEIILVIPQGNFETSIPRTVTLDMWVDAREGTFSRLYQLGHYRVDKVIENEEGKLYVILPVSETLCDFSPAIHNGRQLSGRQRHGEDGIYWSMTDCDDCHFYLLETVVNHLNKRCSPQNNELVTFLTEDVKEKLSPTVDTTPPAKHLWRDAFCHRLIWRIGHCAMFYGIPFLLVSWTAPSWAWLIGVLMLVDCYFSRKAMDIFMYKTTQSLYRATRHWKQVDTQLRQGCITDDGWRLQATRLLADIKVLPLAFLGKKSQEDYIDQVNSYLTLVSDANLTTKQCIEMSNDIQQLLTGYCIRSYY